MLRIMFTSVGRRIELVQLFDRASETLQIPLWIVGADLSMTAPALAFCDEAVSVCRINEPDYISSLVSICREKKIDLVIPTIDTDLLLLAQNKEKFENIGTKVLISSPNMIGICRDKRKTADFFHSCGLLSPDPVDQISKYEGKFPCFIKPLDGSSSINAYRADDMEKLITFADQIGEGKYIIQPFISGREYTIDIFCDFSGNPVFITPRERLAVRSGEVLKTRITQDEQMIREAQALIEKFRPIGPITVQLIREEKSGEDYFIEINPRFGGGAPLSIMAGADAPKAILQLLSGVSLSYESKAAQNGLTYSRFDQSICVEKRIHRSMVCTNWQSISETVKARIEVGDLKAVLLDLDDTMYAERYYVENGFREVSKVLSEHLKGEEEHWYQKLMEAFGKKDAPVDEIIANANLDPMESEKLKKICVSTYRNQKPEKLPVYDGVFELLSWLRENHIPTGIITDGRPEGQHAKLAATGLENKTDRVIITDELGGAQFRKPCDIAFRIMQTDFQVPYDQIVYIGNNPKKDFKAAKNLGMQWIWFLNEDDMTL